MKRGSKVDKYINEEGDINRFVEPIHPLIVCILRFKRNLKRKKHAIINSQNNDNQIPFDPFAIHLTNDAWALQVLSLSFNKRSRQMYMCIILPVFNELINTLNQHTTFIMET